MNIVTKDLENVPCREKTENLSTLNQIVINLCIYLRNNAKSQIPEKLALLIDFVNKNSRSRSEKSACFSSILELFRKKDDSYSFNVYNYKKSQSLYSITAQLNSTQILKYVYLCGKMCDSGYLKDGLKVIIDKEDLNEFVKNKIKDPDEFIHSLETGTEDTWYKSNVGESEVTDFGAIKETKEERERLSPKSQLCFFTLCVAVTSLNLITESGIVFIILISFPFFFLAFAPFGTNKKNNPLIYVKFEKILLIIYSFFLPFLLISYMYNVAESTFDCKVLSEYAATANDVNVCKKGHLHEFSPIQKRTYLFIENCYTHLVPAKFKKEKEHDQYDE